MSATPSESEATDEGGGSTARQDRDRLSAARAMQRWAGFPARLDPRPIVLLHSAVLGERGFATGDAKIAFLRRYLQIDKGVPDEPARLLQVTPTTNGRLPPSPLEVTGANLAEAAFATDRGRQVLPAWRVDANDTLGPIWVLAEAPLQRCWWPPALTDDEQTGPHVLVAGTIAPNGHELTVDFVGGSEELFRYDAETVETPSAVTVVPLQHFTRKLPPGTAIKLVGYPRVVRVHLSEPLGGRVLANLDGSPVEVVSD